MEKLSDVAYDKLMNLIGSRSLYVGDVISHRKLESMLNMSKQPISQALDRMQAYGVVESIPRVGTRILPVTPEDIWGSIQWRVALECRTACLAAHYGKKSEKQKLLELAESLDQMIVALPEKMSLSERQHREMEFHLYLAQCSHCKRLEMELHHLDVYYLKSLLSDLVCALRRNTRAVLHVEISQAIWSGDGDKASALMKWHIEKSSDMAGFTEWYRKEMENGEENE